MNMLIYQIIVEKLEAAFEPEALDVIDESSMHKGHVGEREGGETHFSISIISKRFNGLSRLQCHKLVYSILNDEMKGRVHALRIFASSPEEK
jgi:BolA family transcriptional regulator, general stress-responsive regulator